MFKQFIICLLGLLFSFSACRTSSNVSSSKSETTTWMQESGKIKVLSTIAMIDDLVREIGGDYIDALTLIKGDLDPHSYQLVKGDDEKFARADLIFFNGLGLEHGPSLQQYLQTNPKAIGVGDYIQKLHPDWIIYINGQTDPHVWMDIEMWSQTIPLIVQQLAKRDPVHAQEFEKNGQKLFDQLMQTHQDIRQMLSRIPENKRYLVTSHDAFNYFTRAYLASSNQKTNLEWQERFAAPEGLAPESQLSTSEIQYIIDYLKRYRIKAIFPESNVSKDSLRKIVQAGKEKGVEVKIASKSLFADAMGGKGTEGDTYPKMMWYNAQVIADHLNHGE